MAIKSHAATIASQDVANTAPIDLTISNHSSKSGPMYIYMIGTVGEGSTVQGYVDASGIFHAWPQSS